jgi:arsenate reductase (thioredoxin)
VLVLQGAAALILTRTAGDRLMSKPFNVLFLCTGNSARSILGEAIMNRLGSGRFRAFSAGSQPKGAVHPLALELLQSEGLSTEGLRSKSWSEFAAGAPEMQLIVTVCDQAAGEVCPIWPGHPVVVHWGLPDPAAVDGILADRRAAFDDTFEALERRIHMLISLPVEELDPATLKRRAQEIAMLPSSGARKAAP